MEPFDLRSIPFAQLDRIVTERVYEEPPLRTVLDNHTFGHSRRRYRVEARIALGLWMEIYLYARNDVEPDENVDVERGGNLTHEVIFTEPILHFAENYFRQLPAGQPAKDISFNPRPHAQ